MSSYTREPWIFDSAENMILAPQEDGTFKLIGQPRSVDYAPEVRDCNGYMMAAAPEMFAALLGVLRVADRATDEFDAVRFAIAKATQGEIIGRGKAEAVQRARIQAKFAARVMTPATADFDLPALNDKYVEE